MLVEISSDLRVLDSLYPAANDYYSTLDCHSLQKKTQAPKLRSDAEN